MERAFGNVESPLVFVGAGSAVRLDEAEGLRGDEFLVVVECGDVIEILPAR